MKISEKLKNRLMEALIAAVLKRQKRETDSLRTGDMHIRNEKAWGKQRQGQASLLRSCSAMNLRLLRMMVSRAFSRLLVRKTMMPLPRRRKVYM